uniref:Uncharacterized protein n=1 Tax=Lygus hesperus TaxID=30085 RepID=A0A0A9X6X5_LYGHE
MSLQAATTGMSNNINNNNNSTLPPSIPLYSHPVSQMVSYDSSYNPAMFTAVNNNSNLINHSVAQNASLPLPIGISLASMSNSPLNHILPNLPSPPPPPLPSQAQQQQQLHHRQHPQIVTAAVNTTANVNSSNPNNTGFAGPFYTLLPPTSANTASVVSNMVVQSVPTVTGGSVSMTNTLPSPLLKQPQPPASLSASAPTVAPPLQVNETKISVGNATFAALHSNKPPKFSCIMLSGLPSTGKTTIGRALVQMLRKDGK